MTVKQDNLVVKSIPAVPAVSTCRGMCAREAWKLPEGCSVDPPNILDILVCDSLDLVQTGYRRRLSPILLPDADSGVSCSCISVSTSVTEGGNDYDLRWNVDSQSQDCCDGRYSLELVVPEFECPIKDGGVVVDGMACGGISVDDCTLSGFIYVPNIRIEGKCNLDVEEVETPAQKYGCYDKLFRINFKFPAINGDGICIESDSADCPSVINVKVPKVKVEGEGCVVVTSEEDSSESGNGCPDITYTVSIPSLDLNIEGGRIGDNCNWIELEKIPASDDCGLPGIKLSGSFHTPSITVDVENPPKRDRCVDKNGDEHNCDCTQKYSVKRMVYESDHESGPWEYRRTDINDEELPCDPTPEDNEETHKRPVIENSTETQYVWIKTKTTFTKKGNPKYLCDNDDAEPCRCADGNGGWVDCPCDSDNEYGDGDSDCEKCLERNEDTGECLSTVKMPCDCGRDKRKGSNDSSDYEGACSTFDLEAVVETNDCGDLHLVLKPNFNLVIPKINLVSTSCALSVNGEDGGGSNDFESNDGANGGVVTKRSPDGCPMELTYTLGLNLPSIDIAGAGAACVEGQQGDSTDSSECGDKHFTITVPEVIIATEPNECQQELTIIPPGSDDGEDEGEPGEGDGGGGGACPLEAKWTIKLPEPLPADGTVDAGNCLTGQITLELENCQYKLDGGLGFDEKCVEKLKGPTGDIGPIGPTGFDGKDGKDGADGKDGEDGKPGCVPGIKWDIQPAGECLCGGNAYYMMTQECDCVDTNDQPVECPWIVDPDTRFAICNPCPVPGPTGGEGQEGPTGIDGPTGSAGGDGEQGPTGNMGPTGKEGGGGKDGPTGKAGGDGKEGPTGKAGDDGKEGPTGKAGKDGGNGKPGKDGPTGKQGDDGKPGPTGKEGPTGCLGECGPTGFLGPTGAGGKEGPTGEKGPTGSSGENGHPGEGGCWDNLALGDPIGDGGEPCETFTFSIYIYTCCYVDHGWGWTADCGTPYEIGTGSFTVCGGSIGPTGPLGPTGCGGECGVQGPTGCAGECGPTGASGPTGEAGCREDMWFDISYEGYYDGCHRWSCQPNKSVCCPGPWGYDCSSYPAGESVTLSACDGPTGADGMPGPTGCDGQCGPTGIGGERGPTGAMGEKGPTGPEGPTGSDGEEGPTGSDGKEGPTGNKGEEGPTGIDGTEGPTGPEGPTGNKGNEGPTGVLGEPGTVSCESMRDCIADQMHDLLPGEMSVLTVCPGPTAWGYPADARCVWEMVGDVETLLHNINYGDETPGHSGGGNL